MTLPRILAVGEEPPALEAARDIAFFAGPKKGRRPARERFAQINALVDVTLAKLERAEMAVWLILWRDTKPDGLARTSQDDLAQRAGCNPRTVRRAIEALQAKGLLTVVRQGGLPRRMSVYRVHPVRP